MARRPPRRPLRLPNSSEVTTTRVTEPDGTTAYILKWHKHSLNMGQQLYDRIQTKNKTPTHPTDQTYHDCTIHVENNVEFKVHRVALAACSPYFQSMLNKMPKGTTHRRIVLPDVKARLMEQMISYIYTGQLDLTEEQMPAMAQLARTLQIRGLENLGDLKLPGEPKTEPNAVGGQRSMAPRPSGSGSSSRTADTGSGSSRAEDTASGSSSRTEDTVVYGPENAPPPARVLTYEAYPLQQQQQMELAAAAAAAAGPFGLPPMVQPAMLAAAAAAAANGSNPAWGWLQTALAAQAAQLMNGLNGATGDMCVLMNNGRAVDGADDADDADGGGAAAPPAPPAAPPLQQLPWQWFEPSAGQNNGMLHDMQNGGPMLNGNGGGGENQPPAMPQWMGRRN